MVRNKFGKDNVKWSIKYSAKNKEHDENKNMDKNKE